MAGEIEERLRLATMDEERFLGYRVNRVRDYAREKVRAGSWSQDEAQGRAAKEVDDPLLLGPETPDHYVYSVRDETGAGVGIVWFAADGSGTGRRLWIYDIVIHEAVRRRGYGARAMELVEEMERDLGAGRVELHVFGPNHGARKLYERTGYTVVGITMAGTVTDGEG